MRREIRRWDIKENSPNLPLKLELLRKRRPDAEETAFQFESLFLFIEAVRSESTLFPVGCQEELGYCQASAPKHLPKPFAMCRCETKKSRNNFRLFQ
jgi:hypothetical protein